jgi:D-3-phosphoglycerate dehydrogenase
MICKILNTIPDFSKKAGEILSQIGEVDYLRLTQQELEEKIGQYQILVVGLGLNINRQVLDRADNLKIIATATTGLDHIDLGYAKSKGIEVLSLRGENDFLDTITGTAELAFGLMLDLMRNISASYESVKEYEWDREKFRGYSVAEKTLGIVGLGRLGKIMARYGNVFGMKVIVYDPNLNDEKFEKLNCRKVNFETLVEESDAISIHVHLNQETENMFSKDIFEKMKPAAYLINTSRGKIVNEIDLLEALKNKKIAGYAADVLADELNFEHEFSNNPLVEYAKHNSNLIIVPHIGGMTHESREATDIFIAEKITKHLKK